VISGELYERQVKFYCKADLQKPIANYSPLNTSEFAVLTSSKDGKILFVNLQTVGATFAIWGDWGKVRA